MTARKIDPTTRTRCATHGDAPATYLGRERYGCWHCATAEDEAQAVDEPAVDEPAVDVVLIGCTKTKRTEPAPARDLYDPSDLFLRRRAYAEASGKPWGILSALYGVVRPDRVIRPYDMTIQQRLRPDWSPGNWAACSIASCFKLAGRETVLDHNRGHRVFVEPLTIEVHAGIDYVRALTAAAEHFEPSRVTIVHPVGGLGIGQQKRFYACAWPARRTPAVATPVEPVVSLPAPAAATVTRVPLTDAQRSERASKAGKASREALTPEQRSEVARLAAAAARTPQARARQLVTACEGVDEATRAEVRRILREGGLGR